jgi:hypothetical protein
MEKPVEKGLPPFKNPLSLLRLFKKGLLFKFEKKGLF